jgi:hypothetical protein
MSISDKSEWNILVENKRKYSNQLHELTKKMIDLDTQITELNNKIRNQRTIAQDYLNELNMKRKNIEKANIELLSISDQISKSKDFIRMLEKSTKTVPESELEKTITILRKRLDDDKGGSVSKNNSDLKEHKNSIMQLEALNALKTVRSQLTALNSGSMTLINTNTILEKKRTEIRQKLTNNKISLRNFQDARKNLINKKTLLMQDYDEILTILESVNRKMDTISKNRKYSSHGRSSDQQIIEIKNNAAKKIKEGGKISLAELKLLYEK